MIDALVADLYGLDGDQLGWILRDCDHPTGRLADARHRRGLDPKGFWRVDRTRPPGERHTVLTLAALGELRRAGAAAFVGEDGGDGWRPPGRTGEGPGDARRIDPARGWADCAEHARRRARIRALAELSAPR